MIKQCVICGKDFDAQGKDKVCSKECRKAMKARYQREHREKHRVYNREWMRRYRAQDAKMQDQMRQGITADSYAERQKQKTLEMAGRVQI